ncbi:MAG TPA: hypothetical protein V6D33_16235 [Cyanophyceae cyanobacterium]
MMPFFRSDSYRPTPLQNASNPCSKNLRGLSKTRNLPAQLTEIANQLNGGQQ